MEISKSLKTELFNYIKDEMLHMDDKTVDCPQELTQIIFNTSHYVIGYYKAKKWARLHELDVFDMLNVVNEYEESLGEHNNYDNWESLVNMYVYVIGEHLLHELANDDKLTPADVPSDQDVYIHVLDFNSGQSWVHNLPSGMDSEQFISNLGLNLDEVNYMVSKDGTRYMGS